MIEVIGETTVGDLNGVRVPMGNMLPEGSYTLPDGTETRGTCCTLALPPNGRAVVGRGSQIEIGGLLWLVTDIERKPGALGWVKLESIG